MSYQVQLAVTLQGQTRGATTHQDQGQVRRGILHQDQARAIATPTLLRGQVMASLTRPLHGPSLRALSLKVAPSIEGTNGCGGPHRPGTKIGTARALLAVDQLPQLDVEPTVHPAPPLLKDIGAHMSNTPRTVALGPTAVHRAPPPSKDIGAHMNNAPRMVALEPTAVHRAPPLSKEIAHMCDILRVIAPDLLDPKIDLEDLIRVVLSLKWFILGLCLEVVVEVLGKPLGVPSWEVLEVPGEDSLTPVRVLTSKGPPGQEGVARRCRLLNRST